MKNIRLARVLAFTLVSLAALVFSVKFWYNQAKAAGVNYYVDSLNGSDSNSGTSETSAWKTLSAVQNHTFQPGDIVNFKRGSSWSGGLTIKNSGTSGNPITFQAYGMGNRPLITNPGSNYQKDILIQASWLIVQDFLLADTHEAGVYLQTGANNNTIRNIEVTNTGIGIIVRGQYNILTQNYAHGLHMVVNTSGGNDDYGAEGFWLESPNNEISYNRCVNCRALSFDYGHDGGVIEIYGNGDNSYIHHNYGSASNGFIEVGGGTARDVRVAYNLSDNNYETFACFQIGGSFSSTFDNFKVENNTIVNTTGVGYRMLDCMTSSPGPTELLFRNNIVYTNVSFTSQTGFSHTNNIYYLMGGAQLGYSLGQGEKIADPLFVNQSVGDYHLRSASSAIDAGVNLGYKLDFDNNSVPQGTTADIGAYEYGATFTVSDLKILLSRYLSGSDVNYLRPSDGKVNSLDAAFVMLHLLTL